MKKFWAIFAMLFAFTMTSEWAYAKKFGGGKSFGKSYQTAPAQPSKPTAAPSSPSQQPGQPTNGRRGLLGGLMGGLLAGGMIAALFGGAFEGLQIMDILLFALIGFVLFKLFKASRANAQGPAPAVAGGSPLGQPSMQREMQGDAQRPVFEFDQNAPAAEAQTVQNGEPAPFVPFNLPAGFDSKAFLDGAKEHYRTLQDAWNKNDLAKIQEYVTPALYNELRAERASLSGEQHTDVLWVEAELVRADQMFGKAELSVKFRGRYRDAVEGVEEDITDIWHLERDLGQAASPWYISGVESSGIES